jgi:hypothetical protein
MFHPRPLVLAALTLTVALFNAHGGTIDTIPPGLVAGDTYRLAFVTSATTDATSSDISVYNTFVQNLANAVPALNALNATWTAIASTQNVNAVDNIDWQSATDMIYGLNGTFVSGPSSLLFFDSNDGFFAAPIPTDEDGNPIVSGIVVWTGTSRVGTNTVNGCCSAPLGDGSNSFAGVTGTANVFGAWVSTGDVDTNDHLLYAISSELTVPEQTPEPATGALMLVGALALVGHRLKYANRRRGTGPRTEP